MKGVILAGGYGTRLRPFTSTRQKQLVPIANTPVIAYAIRELVGAGIDEIAIVLGGTHPDSVREYVAHSLADHVAHSFVDRASITFVTQGEPLGLAHAVGAAERFVGDEPFVVYFGDTIVEPGLVADIVDRFEPSTARLFLPVQSVGEPSRFGIVDFAEGSPVAVSEKPADPPSTLAYMGVVGFTPTVFDYIAAIEPSDRGERELTDVIDALVRSGRFQWDRVDGTWIDVGTPDDVVAANAAVLARRDSVSVGTGCRVSPAATLVEPVVIGDDVTISGDAEIGPSVSLGDGCRVDGANLSESVLFDRCTVADCRLTESVLGERAVARGLVGRRAVIGPDSVVRSTGRST